MDPHVAWAELLEARFVRDWDRAEELAQGLLEWLDKGGVPPTTIGDSRLGKKWHRNIAHTACLVDVKQARKRAKR
jgi:hypothetical protein